MSEDETSSEPLYLFDNNGVSDNLSMVVYTDKEEEFSDISTDEDEDEFSVSDSSNDDHNDGM